MDGADPLCEAARNGDAGIVKSLIDSGADVSHFDGEGLTPLMHAAKHGHADVAKSLLEAGAPWNALSPSNLSAGDFAMDAGHQEAFDILLNAGTFSLSLISFSRTKFVYFAFFFFHNCNYMCKYIYNFSTKLISKISLIMCNINDEFSYLNRDSG